MDKLDNIIKKVLQEGDTYEKMAAKGKKAGNLKQGTVRKRLGIPKDEKIPLSKINKEISRLKKMDKDKDKKGVQLGDKNQKYYKALQLSKTLKTTTNVNENKFDKAAMDEYGKPFLELSIAQKQELLSYMNRETEKQFQTDYERRRRETSDYMNEEFKKGDKVTYLGNPAEITFVGKDVMGDIYYSVAYDRGTGRTKVSNLYNKGGEIKAVKEDINDPVLVKTRAAQMKRDAIDKKDLENKSKRISAEKAIDLRYELSILNKEREDILMRIEDIGVEMDQTAEPEGGPIADELGERLMAAQRELRAIDSKIIDIKDDLGVFDMNESDLDEGTCGYGKNGILGEEPAGAHLQKEEDYSKMHNVELNATYKKKFGVKDTKGLTRDELIKRLKSIDEELFTPNEIGDELVGKEYASPAFESLYQSLKEKLNQRLGK